MIASLPLALLTAVLALLSSEPFGISILGWVAFVGLFVAIARCNRARQAAALGGFAALVYFGVHLSWIFLFGWIAYVGLMVLMAIWWTVAALVSRNVIHRKLGPIWLAAIFTASELLRSYVPFGGFEWGAIGLSQASFGPTRFLFAAVGVHGVSFLCFFVAALIERAITRKGFSLQSLAIVAGVTACFVLVDLSFFRPPDVGVPLDVAVIQGNVPRPPTSDQRDQIFDSHLELTEKIGRGADLVVWGEDAIGLPTPPQAERRTQELARQLRAPIVYGRSRTVVTGFRNEMVVATEQGKPGDVYAKQHPVPFGEYVPLSFLRSYVSELDQIPVDLVPGDSSDLLSVNGVEIATPICFESAFARDVRAFASAGSELYVFATNDSSFERSWAASQHLAHARARSLETRQWGVQVALSGHSAVIGPDGELRQQTRLFHKAAFRADVFARKASSLYVMTGDLYALGWVLALAIVLMVFRAKAIASKREPQ